MRAIHGFATPDVFDPGSREMSAHRAEEFRRAMGRLPTGVAIVTASPDGIPVGMTIGTLTYVSSEPLMIIFFVQRTSARGRAIIDAERFAVNVLARNQSAECLRFASSNGAKFEGLEFDAFTTGIPKIRGSVLWLEGHVSSVFDAGDHIGVLGLVDAFEAPPGHGQPLAFYRSKLASLNPASGRHIPTEPLQWW